MNRVVYRDRPAEVLYVGIIVLWALVISWVLLRSGEWYLVVFPLALVAWVLFVTKRTFIAVDDESVVVSTVFGKRSVAIGDITGIQHRRSLLNFRATYRIDTATGTVLLPPPFTLKRYLVEAVKDITDRMPSTR